MSDLGGGSSSSVASRFVSSKALDEAKAKREQEWKAAYERLGQEPPPKPEDTEPYDGRSLFEKLQEQKSKKQEAFEEQLKFKNHFRALDADEIDFLDSLVDDTNEEERQKQARIREEMEEFRKAVTSRQVAPPPASLAPTLGSVAAPSPAAPIVQAKDAPKPASKPAKKQKKTLPGLVVKKKDDKSASGKRSSEASNEERAKKSKME